MIPHSKPFLDENEYISIKEVIESGEIACGKKVEEFEQKFSSYIGMKYGVATSSGTSALHLALIGLNIKEGDEVILPIYVCTAPLNAIFYVGANPVFVNIDYDFNISIDALKKNIKKRTKAIILPHMFGIPAQIDEIINLGIPVIEDCTHSIGAKYKNKMVGSFGEIPIFSFYATKMITTGEGGMLLSNNERLISKIKDIREYDEKDEFIIRYNYKMSNIQAAMGLVQLQKLDYIIKRRKAIAEEYCKRIEKKFIPNVYFERDCVFYRFILLVPDADNFINSMQKRGIECKKPVYKPLNKYFNLNFVYTDKIYNSAVSIPIYPSLKDEEIDFIINNINEELC